MKHPLSPVRTGFFPSLFLVLCVCTLTGFISAQDLPKPTEAVNDLAQVLTPRGREALIVLADNLQRETGFSLVCLTIPALPENISIEEYASSLYAKWGIGAKGRDVGVLVLASIQDRRIRIEVGYGAEGFLPDAICKRIIDQLMVPAFRESDFDGGFVGAASEIANRVAAEYHVDPAKLKLPQRSVRVPAKSVPVRLNPFQILIILILAGMLLGTRIGRALLFSMLLSSMMSGNRSSGRGGFGDGFSGRGGFGGFGGGLSGGGGASGRW